jgi:hypothetical protein
MCIIIEPLKQYGTFSCKIRFPRLCSNGIRDPRPHHDDFKYWMKIQFISHLDEQGWHGQLVAHVPKEQKENYQS